MVRRLARVMIKHRRGLFYAPEGNVLGKARESFRPWMRPIHNLPIGGETTGMQLVVHLKRAP